MALLLWTTTQSRRNLAKVPFSYCNFYNQYRNLFVLQMVFLISQMEFCLLRKTSALSFRTRYSWGFFIPNAMFIIYVVIFCSIRHKRHFGIECNEKQGVYFYFFDQQPTSMRTIQNLFWKFIDKFAEYLNLPLTHF